MPTTITLDDLELAEIALCLRAGARKDEKDAEAQDSVTVKTHHMHSAEYRDRLAQKVEQESWPSARRPSVRHFRVPPKVRFLGGGREVS